MMWTDGVKLLPTFLRNNYEVHDWKHAAAILSSSYPNEWTEIIDVLTNFRLHRAHILARGGRKSPISSALDGELYKRNWSEKSFKTTIVIDDQPRENPTHKIDCYKNRVALEVQWNNKDEFYDRDLNNFRILFELGAISVGIEITRSDELQEIFNQLGKGKSYGPATTHVSKLLPRIQGGGGGGCPIVVFGITKKLYVP